MPPFVSQHGSPRHSPIVPKPLLIVGQNVVSCRLLNNFRTFTALQD